ncbi:MAG: type II toxin-antitoxin system HipA family toxin [Coriobacteriales bacterium]|jgi:serine/threonine-protein kinase HipA
MTKAATVVWGDGVDQLGVFIGKRRVGTLALTPEGLAAFEYDGGWLRGGFSISPYSLPLRAGVFMPEVEPFGRLFGVFQDSLPDGWGALLLDRMIREHGGDPARVSPMTRLAIVGSGGRGALRYEPEIAQNAPEQAMPDLDRLADECRRILDDTPASGDLDELYKLGGSSAGARPKAYVRVDGAPWLVKFPSSVDPPDVGTMEYAYSLAAGNCGIRMAPTRLFESRTCAGYFGSARFDRDANGAGIHMVTASGMLEVSHRLSLIDYGHLFQVTRDITGDDPEQAWELYRVMCFNVFAHNQDDHSNNFAWLCADGRWELSPAYDLTYSTSFGGEHSTTVGGHGNPGIDDVVDLAGDVGLPRSEALRAAREIEARCKALLVEVGRG